LKNNALMACLFAALFASSAFASDHNNIDSGRPLRFDDAYSIGFGERAIEYGLSSAWLRGGSTLYGGKFEFKYGFAMNRDIGISFSPSYSSEDKRFAAGEIELSYFQQIQREIDNAPAFAFKLDVGLPADREGSGIDARLRGIMTKSAGQYDNLHINLDLIYASNPHPGERDVRFGAVFGYSNPLGAPTKFDRTLVAQFALEQGRMNGEGFTGNVGIGMRKQVSEQGVFDFGIESDIFAPSGSRKSPIRLILGYSVGF
jgi:hypothetical protein